MNHSQLTDYLAGELTKKEQSQVDRELTTDAEAARELGELRQSADLVKGALDEERYHFSPGEMASLRQKLGLSALGESDKVVSLSGRLARGIVWVGAAAACVTAMFLLIRQGESDLKPAVAGNAPTDASAAGGAQSELWAPVAWASDPGSDLSGPELIGIPKVMPALEQIELAELRSPDLTKIDRKLSLELSPKVGDGSFEELREALIDRGELPQAGMVRIDELGNYFHQEFQTGVAVERFSHPWRSGGQILLVRSAYGENSPSLQLDGEGTFRLFGEQTPPEESASYQPSSLRPLVSRKVRLWWAEGDLDDIDVSLRGSENRVSSQAGSSPADWEKGSPEFRASLLLIGLGEFIRESSSAPSAADLLKICESLRSESTGLDERFVIPVRMAETAVKLKSYTDKEK